MVGVCFIASRSIASFGATAETAATEEKKVCVFCRIGRSQLDVGEEAGMLCVHALDRGAITASIFN